MFIKHLHIKLKHARLISLCTYRPHTCTFVTGSITKAEICWLVYYIKSPFIYVLGTKPWQNVLGTCSRYTSVHITSTVKCSRYRFVQICNRHNSRAAQYDVLCIHCATCEVILMCTLRADSGLRAKPRPLSTLFSVP